LGLSLLLLLRHKENIRNLLAGREGAFRQRKA
jgi:glycerol-3-phosphate acyltransferase PlsY